MFPCTAQQLSMRDICQYHDHGQGCVSRLLDVGCHGAMQQGAAEAPFAEKVPGTNTAAPRAALPRSTVSRSSRAPSMSARLDWLFDLGGGVLLLPFVRRQDEGRALAALEPVAAPLSALVRRWTWPMPRRWGRKGSGPGQFDHPDGVAVSSCGDIVVCDTGNHCVQVFRADGTFVRQWGSRGAEPGQFFYPWAVAVSSADEVFVTDSWNHRVQVFRLDGSFVRSWGNRGTVPGQFQYPAGVAVHCNLVLISDYSNARIQCFGLDGTFVRLWGSHGAATGQFKHPQGLAVLSAFV